MRYRRVFVPGGTYFFTTVTYERRKILANDNHINALREAFREVMLHHPFRMDACVILPDHIHTIWTLPPDDCDYSTRWRLIKGHFTHNFTGKHDESLPASRKSKGEAAIWQRRFWEHLIRDEQDLSNHVEYIHYNPVKHGLVTAPIYWRYSSFHRYVQEGMYSADWCIEPGINLPGWVEPSLDN